MLKGDEILQQVVQKKETKLRRAVSFFKHFGGWKNLSRQNNASPSLPCKNSPLHRWNMNRRIRDKHELEGRPCKSWLHELDTVDCNLECVKHHGVEDLKDPKSYGTDITRSSIATFTEGPELKCPSTSMTPVELCGSDPPCYELLSNELQRPELSAERSSRAHSDYLMDLDEPEAFDLICPISPTLTIRESTFTPLSDLVSPISPIGSSTWSDLLSPISPIESGPLPDMFSPITPIESSSKQWTSKTQARRPVLSIVTNTESANTEPAQRHTANDDGGPNRPYRHFANGALQPRSSILVNGYTGGLLSKNELPTSQTLIKDVRDLVSVLDDYWMKKLSSVPGLPARLARFQVDSPIEAGLQSIQHCFRGVLPRTFTEVFSLAELAFACAYIIYENDDAYSWDAFFRDILELGQAIADKEDQLLFSSIAFLIWSPPDMPHFVRQGVVQSKQPFQASLPMSIASPSDSRNKASFIDGNFSSSMLQQFNQPSRLSAGIESHADVLDILKNGKVIRVCSHYLDGNPFFEAIVNSQLTSP